MLLDAYFFFLFIFNFYQFWVLSFSLLLTLINFIAFKTLISVINQRESFPITYHYIVTYYFLIGKQPFLPYFMVSCKVLSIRIWQKRTEIFLKFPLFYLANMEILADFFNLLVEKQPFLPYFMVFLDDLIHQQYIDIR